MKMMGCDLYNMKVTGDIACPLTTKTDTSPARTGPKVLIVLNDQGGGIMDVSEKVTMTLRAQEHGHQPIVCFEDEV